MRGSFRCYLVILEDTHGSGGSCNFKLPGSFPVQIPTIICMKFLVVVIRILQRRVFYLCFELFKLHKQTANTWTGVGLVDMMGEFDGVARGLGIVHTSGVRRTGAGVKG